MAKYLIQDTTLKGIADAIRTKTGKTDKIPVSDLATEIEGITGGAEGIIEVDTLPTENIDKNALYKVGDRYYQHKNEFTDLLLVESSEVISYTEFAPTQGWIFNPFSVDNYEAVANPNPIMDTSTGYMVMSVYYDISRNDVFGYQDGAWMSLSGDGYTNGGAITDISEATEDGYYYALFENGWKEYLAPEGSITVVANGTFDVTEKADVTVNVPAPEGYIKPSGSLSITDNGTKDVTSYASVTVNVKPTLQAKTVTENGNVFPDAGYDGLSNVTVDVPTGGGGAIITTAKTQKCPMGYAISQSGKITTTATVTVAE